MPAMLDPVRSNAMINAFTVDVEDYFHVEALSGVVTRDSWDQREYRVEAVTNGLLELLAQRGVRGTFFILGWVAQRSPGLVRAIHAAGHEVACHGMSHRPVYSQTPEVFRSETRESKQLLEDIIGARVLGYRAATFSITNRSSWAFTILEELGFRYDSSVFPVRHDLYGSPDAPRRPYSPANSSLLEIPMTTVQIGRQRLPCSGGGYFRIFPYSLFRWCWRRANNEGIHGVFYMHPWELDPGQPRVAGLSWKSRFRHYTNLGRTRSRLDKLLTDFRWDRMDRVFGVA